MNIWIHISYFISYNIKKPEHISLKRSWDAGVRKIKNEVLYVTFKDRLSLKAFSNWSAESKIFIFFSNTFFFVFPFLDTSSDFSQTFSPDFVWLMPVLSRLQNPFVLRENLIYNNHFCLISFFIPFFVFLPLTVLYSALSYGMILCIPKLTSAFQLVSTGTLWDFSLKLSAVSLNTQYRLK